MKRLSGFAAVALLVLSGAGAAPSAVAAPPQAYYWLVFNDPVAGQEVQYDIWYDTQHLPAILAMPGFISAQRMVFSAVQMQPAATSPRYLALYRIATPDIGAVIDEFRRHVGAMTINRPYDDHRAFGYTYRATDALLRAQRKRP